MGVQNPIGAETGEDWTFIEVEPEGGGHKAKAKAKGARGAPKAKAKAKAKNGEVYFDDCTYITQMVLHFNLDCPQILQTDPRSLPSCRICRGHVTPFSTLYFTKFGQCYHMSDNCRNLRCRNKTYENVRGWQCHECAENEL